MSEMNKPEMTAQVLVAVGAVFMLVSAYFMGVYVPNAKELSDDFDSRTSFDGDMTLFDQTKSATLQGDYDASNALISYSAADGTNAEIVAKADSSQSDDEKTYYNFNASAFSSSEKTEANRIVTFSDTNNYVDRTTYESKDADDPDAVFSYSTWNPNELPEAKDTKYPNPFVSTHTNNYIYIGEEKVSGIDCYKYTADETFAYSSESILALKAGFDGFLPEGLEGTSAGEMIYHEDIWVGKETGQVADRELDITVNFAPDPRLAGSFLATESYVSQIQYSGTLDGENITADRTTAAIAGTTVTGTDSVSEASRNYLDVIGTLTVIFDNGTTDEKVNSTLTIDTQTQYVQVPLGDDVYMDMGSAFFGIGSACNPSDVNETFTYGNLFLTTYFNTYKCVESTAIPGFIIPSAGIMGTTNVNHYQSVETAVSYGNLDEDGDSVDDTPSLPVFDPVAGYCMNAMCEDRQWSSLIAYALTLTALEESALQIPIKSDSTMDLPTLGTAQMVIDGDALMGSQYHPIVQAGFTDIDAYAASLGLTNPDDSAITYADMPFVIDATASAGFQLPQLGGVDCALGSTFHPLVQASLAAIPGYQALCIDFDGTATYPEICGVITACNFSGTGGTDKFGADFHPFFQASLAEIPGYESMAFHTEGGMSLPYPGDAACVVAGACVMGSSITHPLVAGLLQEVMVGLGQEPANYTNYPWVLSDNMTLPVPDDGTLLVQGKAMMGGGFHPWVVSSPVDGSGLSSLAAIGVDYTAIPWVTIDGVGDNLTQMLPNMTEGFVDYYWMNSGFDGYTTDLAQASFGNQSNPADPNTWDGPVNTFCDASKMDWETYTCIPMYEWLAHPIPLSSDTYMPAIDYYPLPKTSVANLPVMLDSKLPLMDIGAALPVIQPQTLPLYMDYEENVWVDPVTGTVLDQNFTILVSIHFPWGSEVVVQSIVVEYTDAQKLASSASRWTTEFAYTYLPGSPMRADNADFTIMTLTGGYSDSEKSEAKTTIEDTSSALKSAKTIPMVLIGVALTSLMGGFYVYYQNQGGFSSGMDDMSSDAEESAPSMATTSDEGSEEESSDSEDETDDSEEE